MARDLPSLDGRLSRHGTDSFEFVYNTCGLRLRSDGPISGLLADHPESVIDPLPLDAFWGAEPLHLGDDWQRVLDGSVLDESGRPWLVIDRSAGEPNERFYRFTYLDGTIFWLDDRGTAVWIHWSDGSSAAEAALYLTGPVLGLALKLRGHLPLHASCIQVDRGAVLFVGPAGAGKSTTAAAFSVAGSRVLADDTSVVVAAGPDFLICPDGRRIRLWPESTEMLFGRRDALPTILPDWSKTRLDLSESTVQRKPLPLVAVYLLDGEEDDTEGAGIHPCSSAEAAVRLAANVAIPAFPDPQRRANELESLSRLVSSLPVKRWVRPREVDRSLDRLVAAVVKDVRAGGRDLPAGRSESEGDVAAGDHPSRDPSDPSSGRRGV